MKVALGILAVFAFMSFGQWIEITNDTGYDIWYVNISASSDDNWGDDWLASDEVMFDGETWEFDVSDLPWATELLDVQLTDEDGDTYTFAGVDAEDYTSRIDDNEIYVTLSDID